MIILSLIKNAEIINFNIGDQNTITFDRRTLSNHHGNNLDMISEYVSSLQIFIKPYNNNIIDILYSIGF